MGNPLNHLTSLGADAMDNMYDVRLTIGNDVKKLLGDVGGLVSAEPLVITGRLKSFTPPSWKSGTYEIAYHGVKKKVPSTKAEMTRDISLEFRLDANYVWYNVWKALSNLSANAQTGGVSNWIPGIGSGDTSSLDHINNPAGGGEGMILEVIALSSSYIAVNNLNSGDYGEIKEEGGHSTIKWVYKHFWVSECTDPVFNTDGGAPQNFKVTGHFGDCEYPASNHGGPANA